MTTPGTRQAAGPTPAGATGEHPPDGGYVTHRELSQITTVWQRDLDRMNTRMDMMDQHGTRGVTALQSQITDLAKDVAKLEEKMEKHDADHERDERARAANRKWWVTAAIGFVAAVDGPIVTLLLARGGR